MPKSFSNSEKEYIREKLQNAALGCIREYGFKKTTVDEIVKRANIAKGTFYLFYKSKEILLYEVFMDFHNQIQDEFLSIIKANASNMTCEILTDAFYEISLKAMNSGFMKIMKNNELELLMRKLPTQLVADHNERDKDMAEELIKIIPEAKGKDKEVFSTAFQSMIIIILNKEILGGKFEEALRLIIRGVVLQFLDNGEEAYD